MQAVPDQPFNLLFDDASAFPPHRFEGHRYDPTHSASLREVADCCLRCWRLTAPAYFDRVEETGFAKLGLGRILNAAGRSKLPATPQEDGNVTRAVAITDVTEALAIVALTHLEAGVRFPYPRTLHKERTTLQHRGIDIIGYRRQGGTVVLYVVEVMASVDSDRPPSTVAQHRHQLLDETLNEPGLWRFLDDVSTMHDECSEDDDKDVMNGFIASATEQALQPDQAITAVPVLVRRHGEMTEKDWGPFRRATGDFENAALQSSLYFLGVESDETFAGLLDRIKALVSGS